VISTICVTGTWRAPRMYSTIGSASWTTPIRNSSAIVLPATGASVPKQRTSTKVARPPATMAGSMPCWL
jgi:hypothetical protein